MLKPSRSINQAGEDPESKGQELKCLSGGEAVCAYMQKSPESFDTAAKKDSSWKYVRMKQAVSGTC